MMGQETGRMMKQKNIRVRLWHVFGIILLIAFGLLSRKAAFIPNACGDALWAMVMYCVWRIILLEKPMVTAALAAMVTSYAVEFSQLLKPAWLVRLRSTFLGHMLLGQGFLWSDLAAYTVGIAVIFFITTALKRQESK